MTNTNKNLSVIVTPSGIEELVYNTSTITIKDKDCKKHVTKINQLIIKGVESQLGIAYHLSQIADNKLYIKDGYNDIVSFALEAFNYGKAYTYRLINVGRRVQPVFDDKGKYKGYCTLFSSSDADYSCGQLEKMVSISNDEIIGLEKEGKIKKSMPSREIEKVVKEYKKTKKQAEEPTVEEPTVEEPTVEEPTVEEPNETEELKPYETINKLLVLLSDEEMLKLRDTVNIMCEGIER